MANEVFVPFYEDMNSRAASAAKDAVLKNVILEAVTESEGVDTKQQASQLFQAVKRPGVSQFARSSLTNGEGRGIFTWRGDLFIVIDNRLYLNGTSELTSATTRFATSTGLIQSQRVGNDAGVVVKSGNELWILSGSTSAIAGLAVAGVAVAGDSSTNKYNFAKITDSDIPTGLAVGVVYLDQYVFIADTNGYIYNSNVADESTWTAGERLLAQLESDKLVAIVKHLNYLVALGEWTIEFFYDAANPQGSPLLPLQGSMHHLGCAAGNSVYADEDTVIWLAQNKAGGVQVVALSGMQVQPLSNPAIERIIQAEEDSINSAWGWGCRIQGHLLYFLTLTSSGRTLVYNTSTKTWTEFTTYSAATDTESEFKWVGAAVYSATSKTASQIALCSIDGGYIGLMDFDKYQDQDLNDVAGNNAAIKVSMTTLPHTFSTTKNKFLRRLVPVGDAEGSTSTLSISWSDDDYKNFSTARTVDMSKTIPTLYACGRFQKRAFRLTHEANTPLRLRGLELSIDLGRHEGGNR